MKIELIIPPNPYLGEDTRNPPLGLLYLAAVAENDGYDVGITDLRSKRIEEFSSNIGDSDIYGVTASTPDYSLALEISRIAKTKNPKSWTVLGGAHATSLPESIDNSFDKVVIGEGENSFLRLLTDYSRGENGIRFYQSSPIKDLDSIPYPARHLLPFDSVFSKNAFSVGGNYAATIITSRGCPSRCSFCASNRMWGGKVRFRSSENVVEEIKQIIEDYGIKHFRFQDDTMTLKKDRLRELCKKMSSLNIRWRATTRVDQADLERLRLMKEAGCEEIGYGIESLSQEVLDKNYKSIKLDQIYTALENTSKIGLKYRLFFIVGLPGEPPGYADRIEDFLKIVNPEGIDVSTLVPYPGSDIYHHPEKYGIRMKENDFSTYHMTLGLRENEIDRPLTFVHDVMTEE